jgi:hypothetical protein
LKLQQIEEGRTCPGVQHNGIEDTNMYIIDRNFNRLKRENMPWFLLA